jgi:hypothetical protein
MKEFGRGGRLRDRSKNERAAIVRRAIEIINAQKVYSLSCCLGNSDYRSVFSDTTKRDHSQYELCFILAVIANASASELNNYDGPTSFVVDRGNPKAEHVRLGYEEIKRLVKQPDLPPFNLGSLAFEDDEHQLALQAADLVAWGARRIASGAGFHHEFKSIEEMLRDETAHNFTVLPRQALLMLEAHFESLRDSP